MNKIEEFTGDYEFLSNFYPSAIYLNDYTYPTVEHAYQAAKTLNNVEHLRIANAFTAGKAKKLGRTVQLWKDFEKNKVLIMKKMVMLKFITNNYLRELLLKTEDAELIEGNNWNDSFWGVCDGKGSNILGKILMDVRAYFRDNYTKQKTLQF